MKIALCQYSQEWENREASRKKISSMLSSHEKEMKGCSWIAFSEMTLSGFTMNRAASETDESDHSFFRNIAEKYSCAVSYCGAEDGFNTFFFMGPDGAIKARYRKNHLFSYAGEDKHYKAGNSKAHIVFKGLRISPAICFDLRFAYHFWEQAADTDFYVIPAAWPEARIDQWKALLKARAIENQAYVAGINRTGSEPAGNGARLKYAGGTMLFDPLGNCVLDAGDKEGIFAAEIDPSLPELTRTRFPFMKERRK